MEESEAIKLLAEWKKINSPQEADNLLFYLSSWISDKEEELTEVDGMVAQARLVLIQEHQSVAKADAYLECSNLYIRMKQIERELRKLKSARSNVNRRYQIITNKILQTQRRY